MSGDVLSVAASFPSEKTRALFFLGTPPVAGSRLDAPEARPVGGTKTRLFNLFTDPASK
jgi:hypothetical protein